MNTTTTPTSETRPKRPHNVRVSTSEQAAGGLGLDAQRAAIRGACQARGSELRQVFEDAGVSAKTNYRPGLAQALAACAQENEGVIIVAKLDRLVRSLTGYAAIVERARSEGWRLLALDTPETDTPHGEAMQGITAVFAQLERRLIGQRTKEALAAARSRGVRLGRPPAITDEIVMLIGDLRTVKGMSTRQIGRHLEAAGIPAPHGGQRWHPSAVARALAKSSEMTVDSTRSGSLSNYSSFSTTDIANSAMIDDMD